MMIIEVSLDEELRKVEERLNPGGSASKKMLVMMKERKEQEVM